tara:strand:+ start:1220 stop:2725 length:1506 start_codon:yes stop_codon:yes gene_type:complete
MIFFNLFFIFISSFFSRYLFSKNIQNSDEWQVEYYLFIQNKKWINTKVIRSIKDGYMGMPFFFYFLISKISKKVIIRYKKYIGIFFDIIVCYSIYFLSQVYLKVENNISLLLCLLIFVTSPALHALTARLDSLKARSFGLFLSFLYMISLYEVTLGNYYFILPSILFIYITFISSSFSMQFCIFSTIILAFIYLDIFILIPLLGLLIIGLLSGSGVKEVFYHKINHYLWYFNNYEGTTAEGRNNIKDFLSLPFLLFFRKKKFLKIFFKKNSFILLFLNSPSLILVIFFLQNADTHQYSPFYLYCYNIIIASFIIFFVTSLKPFLFLGQAERYFEYTLPFIVLYIMHNYLYEHFVLLNLIIVIFQILIIFIYFYIKNKKTKNSYSFLNDEELKKIVKNITSKNKKINVLCIPIKFAFKFFFLTKNNIYFYFPWIMKNFKIDGFQYMKNDLWKYNFPKTKIDNLVKKYKIEYLIILNKHQKHYNLNNLKIVLKEKNFTLLKII